MSDTVTAAAPASAPTAPVSGGTSAQTSNQTSAPSAGQSQTSQAPGNPNAQAQSQGQPKAGETQTQAEKRYLESAHDEAFVKVKIDGEEREITVKELKRLTSLEQASQKRMREAQLERRKAEHLNQLFKSDPEQWSKVTGIDLDSFAEERLAKKYEIEQMSPEQRRIMELEQREAQRVKLDLSSKRDILSQIKELTGEAVTDEVAQQIPKEHMIKYLQEKQQEFQQHQSGVEQEVLGAWKETGLPADAMFGQWVAAMMLNHQKLINAGKVETGPLQAKDAALKVKARLTNSVRSMMTQMDAPAILEFIGSDVFQKLKDHDIARVNQNNDPLFGNKPQSPGQQPASNAPKKQLNQMEWRKAMGIG